MSARNTSLFLALALAGAACSSDDHTGPNAPRSAVDSILAQARAETAVPGMAAIVFRGSSIEAMGVSGVRKMGASAPIALSDRFHLGSNVKAMTATMIATLVEEGKLGWSTRPIDVFPELEGSINPAFHDITLTQLLEHRAGIEPLEDFREVPELPGTPSEQRYQGTAILLSLDPAGPVGEFLYSNGGYGIASAMAERVTGETWEDLMTERLFQPQGITPLFGWPAADHRSGPWGHYPTANGFVPYAPSVNTEVSLPPAISAAGEMALSLEQYLKFGQLNLRGMTGHPELLSAASFTALHTPVGDYALGWGEVDLGGEMTATHNGSSGAFYATIFLQPGRDLGVIVLSNAGGDRAASATVATALLLLNRYGGAVPAGTVAASLIAR